MNGAVFLRFSMVSGRGYISGDDVYCIVSSTRRSSLMRIMEIEKRLHSLENDPKYMELQKNLKTLESGTIGSRHVRIGTPENLDSMIELRRNSDEMEDLIQRYRDTLAKYQNRIEKLNKEKQQLEKDLFPS